MRDGCNRCDRFLHAAVASRGGGTAGGARAEAGRGASARLAHRHRLDRPLAVQRVTAVARARRPARRQHERYAERGARGTSEERRPIRGASLDTSARQLLGDRGAAPGSCRVASLIATRARERSTSSKAAAASRCSRRIRSSIAWTRSHDCGSRRWSLVNRCCRISNGSAARFDTATSPASWPESMYQTVFAD